MEAGFKIFKVGFGEYEYIAAQTAEEAKQDYIERAGNMTKSDIEELEVEEISLDKKGRFETEDGYKEMTFREFLEYLNFTYPGYPRVICWTE